MIREVIDVKPTILSQMRQYEAVQGKQPRPLISIESLVIYVGADPIGVHSRVASPTRQCVRPSKKH